MDLAVGVLAIKQAAVRARKDGSIHEQLAPSQDGCEGADTAISLGWKGRVVQTALYAMRWACT